MQVRRGQAAQVLQSSPLSPDQVSPPRADEPLAKSATSTVPAQSASVEAMKNAGLNTVIEKLANTAPPPNPGTTPPDRGTPGPPVTMPPPVIEVPTNLPDRTAIWGRWQGVLDRHAAIDLAQERKDNELLGFSGYFALFRSPGKEYVAPNNGTVGFSLRGSEAYVTTEYGFGHTVVAPASLSNGSLNLDFGARTFNAAMDVATTTDLVHLRADGTVTGDGRLYSNDPGGRHGILNLQGVLSNDRGGSAATIFEGRLDERRTVNGAATWR